MRLSLTFALAFLLPTLVLSWKGTVRLETAALATCSFTDDVVVGMGMIPLFAESGDLTELRLDDLRALVTVRTTTDLVLRSPSAQLRVEADRLLAREERENRIRLFVACIEREAP